MSLEAWTLGLHLISLHAPNCHDDGGLCKRYEALTPGIYARAPSGLSFGAYRNSYGRGSVYAGWTFETPDKRFALTVAGVTGYPQRGLRPMALPSIRWDLGAKTSLRIAAAPKVGGSAALVHFAIEYKL